MTLYVVEVSPFSAFSAHPRETLVYLDGPEVDFPSVAWSAVMNVLERLPHVRVSRLELVIAKRAPALVQPVEVTDPLPCSRDNRPAWAVPGPRRKVA